MKEDIEQFLAILRKLTKRYRQDDIHLLADPKLHEMIHLMISR